MKIGKNVAKCYAWSVLLLYACETGTISLNRTNWKYEVREAGEWNLKIT